MIVIALCGHGHLDLRAYETVLAGRMVDIDYPRERVDASLAHLPPLSG